MAQRQEIAAVYAGAVIQGIVLVTFPAVSAIFTSTAHYGLSTTEYGGMFAPQAVIAIISSLLGAGITHRIGGKRVFLIGLAADLLSMTLLFISQFATGSYPLAYGLLLAATACLGIGFGFVVPSLNTFTASFFPQSRSSDPHAQCASRSGHRARAHFCGDLRRSWILVGVANPDERPDPRADSFQPATATEGCNAGIGSTGGRLHAPR